MTEPCDAFLHAVYGAGTHSTKLTLQSTANPTKMPDIMGIFVVIGDVAHQSVAEKRATPTNGPTPY